MAARAAKFVLNVLMASTRICCPVTETSNCNNLKESGQIEENITIYRISDLSRIDCVIDQGWSKP